MEDFISSFRNEVRCSEILKDCTLIDLFRKAIDPDLSWDIDTRENVPTTLEGWYSAARRRYDALIRAKSLHK